MCDRCVNTPIDPDDTQYVEGVIDRVIFDAATVPKDIAVLVVTAGDYVAPILCPAQLGPMPGERVRIYGVERFEVGAGSVRGVILGVGADEHRRTAFYRTPLHEHALLARAALIEQAMRELDRLIAEAEADPQVDPEELADMYQTRAAAVEKFGLDGRYGVTRVPSV